jgi:hypothetical protein
MFRFDLSTLDERDLCDTLQSLELLLSCVAGQRNNPCFEYLRDVLKAEAELREQNMSSGVVDIVLPIGEATYSHVWCLTCFTCGVVEMAAKGEPAAMTWFFARVVDQIEAAAQQAASAATN